VYDFCKQLHEKIWKEIQGMMSRREMGKGWGEPAVACGVVSGKVDLGTEAGRGAHACFVSWEVRHLMKHTSILASQDPGDKPEWIRLDSLVFLLVVEVLAHQLDQKWM
jgi:hypothetical protein